jgi:hypothetical protein
MNQIAEPELQIKRYKTLANPEKDLLIDIGLEPCKYDESINNDRLKSNVDRFLCVKNTSELIVQGHSSYRSNDYKDIIQRL